MTEIFNEDLGRPNLEPILADPEALIERVKLHKENFLLWFFDCVNTADEGRGKVLAAPRFAYLKDMYDTMSGIGCEKPHVLWVEKARQIFITWYMVAYCLWLLMYKENVRLIYGSRTEAQVKDTISTRFKVMYDNLTPGFPYPDLEFYTTTIKCPARKTLLTGIASSGEGARGLTAYLIWLDEIAKQENQEQTLAAAIEAVNSPESQLIGVTNPNPGGEAEVIRHLIADSIDAKHKFQKLSRGVERLKNIQGHTILRLKFNAHPAKDEQWEKDKRLEIGEERFQIEHGLNWRVAKGKPCFWAFSPTRSVRDNLSLVYGKPLHIAIDPGTNNPAVLFFQKDLFGRFIGLKAFLRQNTRLLDLCEEIEHIINDEFGGYGLLHFHIDPAGAKNNIQGTDIALEIIGGYFDAPVTPAPVTKPEERIVLINEFFGAVCPYDNSSMILIPSHFGEFYTYDGKLEIGYFTDMLTMGYVKDAQNKAVKDNKYDHMADAFGYGFINVFSLADIRGSSGNFYLPLAQSYSRKEKSKNRNPRFLPR